jgi:hypothetical protein
MKYERTGAVAWEGGYLGKQTGGLQSIEVLRGIRGVLGEYPSGLGRSIEGSIWGTGIHYSWVYKEDWSSLGSGVGGERKGIQRWIKRTGAAGRWCREGACNQGVW